MFTRIGQWLDGYFIHIDGMGIGINLFQRWVTLGLAGIIGAIIYKLNL